MAHSCRGTCMYVHTWYMRGFGVVEKGMFCSHANLIKFCFPYTSNFILKINSTHQQVVFFCSFADVGTTRLNTNKNVSTLEKRISQIIVDTIPIVELVNTSNSFKAGKEKCLLGTAGMVTTTVQGQR